MGWIFWGSVSVVLAVSLGLLEEKAMADQPKDSKLVRFSKKYLPVLMVATISGGILWNYVFLPQIEKEIAKVLEKEKLADKPEKEKNENKLEDISRRLSTLEGRLLSSNKVKKAEAQIAAKLTPNQKTLPVFVDAVDTQEGRIHVRDIGGFSREFSFSNDAKVHEAGKDFSLTQMMARGNPFEGKVGILVYENQASTEKPAVAKSLTLIPAQ